MTLPHDSLRPNSAAPTAATVVALRPAMPSPRPVLSRAGLPVVSNRAFIRHWMLRRHRLVAAAQLDRAT